ncbi:MAG TPA: diaminopimelate epimerase [Clostridia bacterium]|nr:diaminopimelate epimerase [Clostridia bacterium]
MRIPFVKGSACGNDFLIVDGAYAGNDIAALTRRMCDRNNGVGADGVEWLYPSETADARIRLVNADGSDAELSGNGTRCVAAHIAFESGLQRILIATDAGVKTCELTSREGPLFEFTTAMGAPKVSGAVELAIGGNVVTGVPVSMGNPHFVVFVNEFQPGWQALAEGIQRQPLFPQGTNVEFVRVLNSGEIEIRIFERGAGETLSSGTGSSASAAAAIATGRVMRTLQVHTPGGSQQVRWEDELFLTGPARLVCRGEFFV